MVSQPTHVLLPDIVPGKEWPFSCSPHPNAAKALKESLVWVKGFDMYTDDILAKFSRYRIDVLVGWSYRHASPTHLRLCIDFMNTFWIIDDLMDRLSTPDAEKEVKYIKLALDDPFAPPPQGETILGKVVRSFWASVIRNLNPPPATKARFLKNFITYLESLPEEALDRETGYLRGVEEHFHLRRRTGGLYPSFNFIYMPFELPDRIADHPHIKRMTVATGDLVIIANDIYSWNVEQAGGQIRVAHNIVDVIKRTRAIGIQDAFDEVEAMYKRICTGLLNDLKTLPSFDSPYDEVLKFYVEGLVEWVQGNVEFSLASGRYFGELAGDREIRETRKIAILPPKKRVSKGSPLPFAWMIMVWIWATILRWIQMWRRFLVGRK